MHKPDANNFIKLSSGALKFAAYFNNYFKYNFK